MRSEPSVLRMDVHLERAPRSPKRLAPDPVDQPVGRDDSCSRAGGAPAAHAAAGRRAPARAVVVVYPADPARGTPRRRGPLLQTLADRKPPGRRWCVLVPTPRGGAHDRQRPVTHEPRHRRDAPFVPPPQSPAAPPSSSTFVEPNGAAAAHVHPAQQEVFEIVAGELEFRLGSEETVIARPGDRLTVPAGTPHRFRNVGEETAHFVCEVSPALGFEQLIETMFGSPPTAR